VTLRAASARGWRWIVGSVDTEAKSRALLRLTLPLIALDAITKLAALAWLDEGSAAVRVTSGMSLGLVINEQLVAASTLDELEASDVGGGEVLAGVVLMLVGCAVALAFARATWPAWKRVLVVVLVVVVPALLASVIGPSIDAPLSFREMLPLRAASSLALVALLIRLARHPLIVAGTAVLLAGNLGNALNLLYHPRGVIDFLVVPLLSPYVFNVADVVIGVGATLFVIGVVVAPLGRWLGRRDPA
jgi:lipoprotein signal peptidase